MQTGVHRSSTLYGQNAHLLKGYAFAYTSNRFSHQHVPRDIPPSDSVNLISVDFVSDKRTPSGSPVFVILGCALSN